MKLFAGEGTDVSLRKTLGKTKNSDYLLIRKVLFIDIYISTAYNLFHKFASWTGATGSARKNEINKAKEIEE